MSYEGYEEKLCKVGHYSSRDVYDYTSADKCHCGKEFVWSLSTDQTNDEGYPYDDFEVDVEARTEKCPTCKNVKQIEPIRYKIPTLEQKEAFCERRQKHWEDEL